MKTGSFKVPDKALWLAQIADLRNASYSPTRLFRFSVPGGACVSAIVLALLCLSVTFGTSIFPYAAIIVGVKICAYLLWIKESVRAASTQTEAAARHYARFCVLASITTGVCWSLFSICLYVGLQGNPLWLYYALFATTVLTAVCSAALVGLSIHTPSSAGFLLGAVGPFGAVLMSQQNLQGTLLGAAAWLYGITLFVYGFNIKKSHTQSLQLRRENTALLEQYRQAKDEAEASNKAKTRFLAAASHDLRQPLQAMGLLIDLLDRTESTQERNKIIRSVKSSSDTLLEMLNLILDVGRIEAGVVKVKNRKFRLQELFDGLRDDFKLRAVEKDIDLAISSTELSTDSDPQLLRRILANFVSNAIEYTDEGRVWIEAQPTGNGSVRISVGDTGRGIPSEHLEHVFQEYFQVDAELGAGHKRGGMGLGLAIASGLAGALEHQITVESEPSNGSVFSIEMPLAESTPPASETIAKKDPQTMDDWKILIIEDDDAVRETLELVLSSWGLRVRTVTSFADAMRVVQMGYKPDLALSDFRLADQYSGADVLDAIHAQHPGVIGLLLTGDTSPERILAANRSGYRLLHKPVKPLELWDTFKQLLEPDSRSPRSSKPRETA